MELFGAIYPTWVAPGWHPWRLAVRRGPGATMRCMPNRAPDLTIVADSWTGDGKTLTYETVLSYRVDGLPPGDPSVALMRNADTKRWRIHGWNAAPSAEYATPEDALAVLQAELNARYR